MAERSIEIAGNQVRMVGSEHDPYFQNLHVHVPNELRAFAKGVLNQDSVCLDAGANIGMSALVLSKLCPSGHVFAFEASPINARYLQQNVTLNDITNCTVIASALGATQGSTYFRESAYAAGSHVSQNPSISDIVVPVESIDDFLDGKRVDLIKIDVEGFEPAVLNGARKTIERFDPFIYMEFNFWCLYGLQRLDPMGFAQSLLQAFDIYRVSGDGALTPYRPDPQSMIHDNIVVYGCVQDFVLKRKPGVPLPDFIACSEPAAFYKEEIRQLRVSTSWRITAPLRAVKRALSRR